MKKILGILVMLLALAGCGSDAATESTTASSAASESLSDLGSVFAMSGEFKCTYEVDNVQQVSQVKNGKIRSDMTADGEQMHTIMNGDKMWMWSSQGCFYMDLSDIREMSESLPDAQQQTFQSPEDIADSAIDVNCQRASVPDSVFTPPSNCQDMGAMLQQMQSYR